VHPRVALALNELGNVEFRQRKLDEADFSRVVDIYRSVYGEKHYQIGLAESNLGGVYVERKEYARAELLFHDALQIYSETLPADHRTSASAEFGSATRWPRNIATQKQRPRARAATRSYPARVADRKNGFRWRVRTWQASMKRCISPSRQQNFALRLQNRSTHLFHKNLTPSRSFATLLMRGGAAW
jgi:hypothetical protein